MCMLGNEELHSCRAQWTPREMEFVENMRKIMLRIVSKRIEKPPMFVVRD